MLPRIALGCRIRLGVFLVSMYSFRLCLVPTPMLRSDPTTIDAVPVTRIVLVLPYSTGVLIDTLFRTFGWRTYGPLHLPAASEWYYEIAYDIAAFLGTSLRNSCSYSTTVWGRCIIPLPSRPQCCCGYPSSMSAAGAFNGRKFPYNKFQVQPVTESTTLFLNHTQFVECYGLHPCRSKSNEEPSVRPRFRG